MGSNSSCCNSASGAASIEDVLAREEQLSAVGSSAEEVLLVLENAKASAAKSAEGALANGIGEEEPANEEPASPETGSPTDRDRNDFDDRPVKSRSTKSCLSRADSKPVSSASRRSVRIGSDETAETKEVLEVPNLSKEAASNFEHVMSLQEAAAAKTAERSSTETYLNYDCRTSKEGSMWKLNHDVDPDDTAKLSDIMNWRRRDFIFQLNKNTGECAVLYFSEKLNSTAQTFAPVRDGRSNKLVQVEALDTQIKLVMDDSKRREVATKIMNYDTAMSGDDPSMARHRKIENYLEKIPELGMHVLVVKYKDKDDTTNTKLLGFYSAKDLQQWTRQLQNPQLAKKKKGTIKQIKRFFGMI